MMTRSIAYSRDSPASKDSLIEIHESPQLLYRDAHGLHWTLRPMRHRSTPSADCSKPPCTSRLGPQPRKQLFSSDAGTVVFRQLPKLFFSWDRRNRNPPRRWKPGLREQPADKRPRLVEDFDDLCRSLRKKFGASFVVNRNPNHGSPHPGRKNCAIQSTLSQQTKPTRASPSNPAVVSFVPFVVQSF